MLKLNTSSSWRLSLFVLRSLKILSFIFKVLFIFYSLHNFMDFDSIVFSPPREFWTNRQWKTLRLSRILIGWFFSPPRIFQMDKHQRASRLHKIFTRELHVRWNRLKVQEKVKRKKKACGLISLLGSYTRRKRV